MLPLTASELVWLLAYIRPAPLTHGNKNPVHTICFRINWTLGKIHYFQIKQC